MSTIFTVDEKFNEVNTDYQIEGSRITKKNHMLVGMSCSVVLVKLVAPVLHKNEENYPNINIYHS